MTPRKAAFSLSMLAVILFAVNAMSAEMGYTNIKVFHAGAPAWQKEGKPLLAAPEFVTPRPENVVLIDTRGPKEAQKGHIPGAFAIPLDQVVNARDTFPLDTAVPVILYGADTDLDTIAPVISELAAWVDNNSWCSRAASTAEKPRAARFRRNGPARK